MNLFVLSKSTFALPKELSVIITSRESKYCTSIPLTDKALLIIRAESRSPKLTRCSLAKIPVKDESRITNLSTE